MLINILLFLPTLFVCFTEVYCNIWDPRVWPETFVDDGKPFIEFTCGAYLKGGEWLSWYKVSDEKICTTIQQQREGYKTLKLFWPLSMRNYEVYCSKQNESYYSYSGKEYWGKDTHSKRIPINSLREIEPINIDIESGPWVTPAEFVDNGKQAIEFTCYTYLTKGKTLSWNQIKDKSVTKLGMVQQEAHYGYTKITLQKTLEPSDNGSEIYCVKEADTIFIKSARILLTFERHIDALETPYVTVEPSADVAFFDEDEKLEFVCSGSKAVDGRTFTWYLQTPGFNEVVPSEQHFSKSTNQNSLTLPVGVFNHGTLIYCAQDFTLRSHRAVTSISYGELARSRTITLLHRGQCNKKDLPRVTPDKFEDDHKPFIQLTCYSFLKSGQLLSWYQSKGLNKPSASLLRLVQLQDPRAQEGEWVVLILNKTLEPGDNGSEVYCARQSVLLDGSFSDGRESQRVALTFQRDIPPLELPFIHMESNTTSVHLEPNTTVHFTCSGSKLIDGRNYTWFRNDPESGLTLPKDQKYDATTNTNVLDLSLNESSEMRMRLFCAQAFFSYIRHGDSLRLKMYGQLVTSNMITVIQRDKQDEKQNSSSLSSPGTIHLILTLAIPASLLVLVIAAAACWLRRRRAPPVTPVTPATPVTHAQPANRSAPTLAPRPLAGRDKDGYGDYANVYRGMDQASPQVTYAELDLSKNASDAARGPAPESAYAEIAVSRQWH